jgi:polysaccharide export outer membrane protein
VNDSRKAYKLSLSSLVLTLSLLVACHTAPFVWVDRYPRDPAPQRATTAILSGDLIEVRVFDQEKLTSKERVRADGSVTLPLIGGAKVAGLQPSEAAAEIARQLKPFVNDPRVTVTIQRSVVLVTTMGEVSKVGTMELEAPATVLQALAAAGGLGKFADRSGIYVLRQAGETVHRIRFRYQSMIDGDPAVATFLMKTGDVLFVED